MADGKGRWWEGYNPQDLYCRPHDATEAGTNFLRLIGRCPVHGGCETRGV